MQAGRTYFLRALALGLFTARMLFNAIAASACMVGNT
jgi:hypothetical protein